MHWLAKHWARQNCSPTQWLARYFQDRKYNDSDRSVHELRAMSEVFEHAGCYDNLNVSSLASFELLARRWQLILEAHSNNPQAPEYDAHEYFSGLETSRNGVAPVLSQYIARRLRDDAEVSKQRSKAKEARGLPTAPKGGGGGGKGDKKEGK